MRIYAALGIKKEQIDKKQAWQSYIETHFNVQRRMADWHSARQTPHPGEPRLRPWEPARLI
jgi:hypothetical protein